MLIKKSVLVDMIPWSHRTAVAPHTVKIMKKREH